MTPNWSYSKITKAPDELKNGFIKIPSSINPSIGEIYEPVDQQQVIMVTDKVYRVCVLHAGSLYRREAALKIGGFCNDIISTIGHREESLFYTKLYMSGWDLAVYPRARLWHFESSMGGSRIKGVDDPDRNAARANDEFKFKKELIRLQEKHPDRPITVLDYAATNS